MERVEEKEAQDRVASWTWVALLETDSERKNWRMSRSRCWGDWGTLENRTLSYYKLFSFLWIKCHFFLKCSETHAAVHERLYLSGLRGSPGEGLGSVAGSVRMGGPHSSRRLREGPAEAGAHGQRGPWRQHLGNQRALWRVLDFAREM